MRKLIEQSRKVLNKPREELKEFLDLGGSAAETATTKKLEKLFRKWDKRARVWVDAANNLNIHTIADNSPFDPSRYVYVAFDPYDSVFHLKTNEVDTDRISDMERMDKQWDEVKKLIGVIKRIDRKLVK